MQVIQVLIAPPGKQGWLLYLLGERPKPNSNSLCYITRKSGISSNSSATVSKGSDDVVRVLSLSLRLSVLVLCVVASWTCWPGDFVVFTV